jgi:hypothetical protein
MGTYSHLTDSQLVELRDKFTSALNERLIQPAMQGQADKRVQYDPGAVKELRASLAEVTGEIDRRAGRNQRGPIYLV